MYNIVGAALPATYLEDFNERVDLLWFLSRRRASQLQITALRHCVPVLHAAFMARLAALSDLLNSVPIARRFL